MPVINDYVIHKRDFIEPFDFMRYRSVEKD